MIDLSGPWVTRDQVEASLGRPLTDEEASKLGAAIAGAQARIVAAIGWSPFPPTTAFQRLRGPWAQRLELPRRPVLEVHSVSVLPRWSWFTTQRRSQWRLIPPGLLVGGFPGIWGGVDGIVDVEYTYGFEELPADLAALCADLSGLALTSPPEAASGGVESESLGPYRVSYGDVWGKAGAAYGGWEAVIARYRPARIYSLPVYA
jgi:hypothetical protein